MTEDGSGDDDAAAPGRGGASGRGGDSAAAPSGDRDRADDGTPERDPGALRGHADDLEARVDDLLAQAREARATFEPPDEPDERALEYCTDGLWPVLAVYVDRRGAGAALGQPHHDRLQTALNVWLELYARCYGAEIESDVAVREAAELFVSTHNVRDVAQLLTDVPER